MRVYKAWKRFAGRSVASGIGAQWPHHNRAIKHAVGTDVGVHNAPGNRLTKNDSVAENEGCTYNAANILLTRGTNSYSNDPDGNTLTGGGRTNTWDSENRLVSCAYGTNTSSYVYGADGFRHRSTVNGTTTDFALDGQFFVRELQGGTQYATYLTGPTGPLYRRDATGPTLRWYVYDGLGSVLGEVDASGKHLPIRRSFQFCRAIRKAMLGHTATLARRFRPIPESVHQF